MKHPIEDLKDVMGREGWQTVENLRAEFTGDMRTRLSSSCRANDGRHQLYQGKIDGVQEFFDFLKRKVEEHKKQPSSAENPERG